jgi:hypothetical protein
MLDFILAADAVVRLVGESVFWSDGRAIVTCDGTGFGIGYDDGKGTQCILLADRFARLSEAQGVARKFADFMQNGDSE